MSAEPVGQAAPGLASASGAEGIQARRLVRRAAWWRLALVEAVQLPALGLVLLSAHPAAWWVAGIWGSVVCCAGTDSQWRWRNRALVAQALLWLLAALLFGTESRAPRRAALILPAPLSPGLGPACGPRRVRLAVPSAGLYCRPWYPSP